MTDANRGHEFGSRIADMRRARHWKQSELAHAAGMTRAYVKQIEDGRSKEPSARTIGLLAQALDADPIELLQLCGALPAGYREGQFREELDLSMYLRRQRRLSEEFTLTLLRLIRLAEASEFAVVQDVESQRSSR
jgi:transcriptional regulator with XRE-family HTH domain